MDRRSLFLYGAYRPIEGERKRKKNRQRKERTREIEREEMTYIERKCRRDATRSTEIYTLTPTYCRHAFIH